MIDKSRRPIVWIGWDAQEMAACNIASRSLQATSSRYLEIYRLALVNLQLEQVYKRPTLYTVEDGKRRLWDQLSDAPMSTEHANSRFFVPYLQQYQGWALFVDGDILARKDICELFALKDETKAVQVVQHRFEPPPGVKKGGDMQTRYARKNWSSCMLWNCAHPSNKKLTLAMLNSLPGRDLHRFCWLEDHEIGALPPEWNWLVGHSDPSIDPAIVHFTEGLPNVPGYEHVPYADEWFASAKCAGYWFDQPVRVG